MKKINIQKINTFASLKARTLKTIRDHKSTLGQVNSKNKDVVFGHEKQRLADLARRNLTFTFFIKLNLFCEDSRLLDFFSFLRNNRVDYLRVDTATFKGSATYYSDFLENLSKGDLLVINAVSDDEYYRVMNLVLELEREINNSTVNHFRLLFVKENSFILRFDDQNLALRKLYELKCNKQSILFETLSILNYPTTTLINGSSHIIGELVNIFRTLSVTPLTSSEIK